MAFQERIVGPLWQGGGSLIVWALHFFGVYVLVAVGCDAGWSDAPLAGTNVLRALLLLASVFALAVIGLLLWRSGDGSSLGRRASAGGLLAVAARIGCCLALIGVVWVSLPLLMVPLPCAPG